MTASERVTTVSHPGLSGADPGHTGQRHSRLRHMRHPTLHTRKVFHRHTRLRTLWLHRPNPFGMKPARTGRGTAASRQMCQSLSAQRIRSDEPPLSE